MLSDRSGHSFEVKPAYHKVLAAKVRLSVLMFETIEETPDKRNIFKRLFVDLPEITSPEAVYETEDSVRHGYRIAAWLAASRRREPEEVRLYTQRINGSEHALSEPLLMLTAVNLQEIGHTVVSFVSDDLAETQSELDILSEAYDTVELIDFEQRGDKSPSYGAREYS